MTDTSAIEASGALSLEAIAAIAGAALPAGADAGLMVRGAGALEGAREDQIAYMDNPKYAAALAATPAGVCLVSAKFAAGVPAGTGAPLCPGAHPPDCPGVAPPSPGAAP